MVEDITFRNIVVEHEEVGSGDAEEMPYLIDLNIMQNSNWSTTAERGQIRNIVLENVNFWRELQMAAGYRDSIRGIVWKM